MKRFYLLSVLIISIFISFLTGFYVGHHNDLKDRAIRRETLISFAINKLEDLKVSNNENVLEALTSNIYAAIQFTDDERLSSALTELWNALIFNGENLSGKEDELIKSLENADPVVINDLAHSIRQ
ncbi:hypothetical protein E8P77_19610 [Soehngenia saccharolytica]|nr:hypothetical protein E8P77_19610 [Soehngenia saccharolytica]